MNIKIIIGIIVLIFLSGCSVTPEPPPENPIEYRGLFVGNKSNLYSPAINAVKMKTLFRHMFIAQTLINENATKDKTYKAIAKWETDKNDISYFYFMGHGSVVNGIPYIKLYDGNLTVGELETWLSAVRGTKVVILETCHAGNFIEKSLDTFVFKAIDVFKPKDKALNKEGFQVLASSAGDQYTWDKITGSPFMKYFVYGCQRFYADDNEDKEISLVEIRDYLVMQVKQQTAQMYPEGSEFTVYKGVIR